MTDSASASTSESKKLASSGKDFPESVLCVSFRVSVGANKGIFPTNAVVKARNVSLRTYHDAGYGAASNGTSAAGR